MSLSDCLKCWSTPCECGYDYQHWPIDRQIKILKRVKKAKLKDQEKT